MARMIRRLRGDERGVASTVGTIMALLVFLTFLSLIVNQYVPVWMKDSEAAHMNAALGQFGNIKGAIDLQILGAQMAQNAGAPFLPLTTSVAVTLGVEGFPIFSSPTFGAINVNADVGAWNITFSYLINNVTTRVWQNASGAIDLNVGNRYYIQQHIVYENGAVIRAQTDGQIIRAPSLFLVQTSGSNISLAFELVNLYGQGGITGTTTEVVNVKAFATNLQTYGDVSTPVKISHVSLYGLAWFNFLNTTLASGLSLSTIGISPDCSAAQTTWCFTRSSLGTSFSWWKYYSIWANYTPNTGIYRMDLVVRNNPYAISSFTLQQAFVQVGIAEEANANL